MKSGECNEPKTFGEDILFLQGFLVSTGFYKDELDNKHGENTDKALTKFDQKSQQIVGEFGAFDSRSERNTRTSLGTDHERFF